MGRATCAFQIIQLSGCPNPYRIHLCLGFKDVPGGMSVFFAIIDFSHSYFTTVRPIASAIGRVLPYYTVQGLVQPILAKIVVLLHV